MIFSEYGCLPVTVTLALPLLSKVADVADKVPSPLELKVTLSPATPFLMVTVTVTLALPLLSKIAEVADKTPFPSIEKSTLSSGTPLATVTSDVPFTEIAPLLEAVMSGEEIPKLVFTLFP